MQAQGHLSHDMPYGMVCGTAKGEDGKERMMRKGDIVVNPWVSTYFDGELNPNYATIYLGDNKTLDYKGRVCDWVDKIYKDNPERETPWKVIGHIDLYGIAELAIRDAVFAEEIADTPQTDLVKYSDDLVKDLVKDTPQTERSE